MPIRKQIFLTQKNDNLSVDTTTHGLFVNYTLQDTHANKDFAAWQRPSVHSFREEAESVVQL